LRFKGELIGEYYIKGYFQGKHDEKDGVYIDHMQLAATVKNDLTREMSDLPLFNIKD
jgi:hypothetical protein